MELEKSTCALGGISGSGGQVDAGPSTVATPVASLPDAHGDEMYTEDSCTTPAQRAKTIMGLEICVLESRDDVYDPTSGWPQPNFSESLGETASDDDDVPPEVTQELN